MTGNYKRIKPKKKDRLRALIILLVYLFLVGFLTGGLTITYVDKTGGLTACNADNKEDNPYNNVDNFYGTRDGRTFTDSEEPSMDWGAGDLNFVPIECALDEEVQEFAYYLSYSYYIDFPLVMAIMERESSFNPAAESKSNDSGLMQINICNQDWLSKKLSLTDFHDPYQNIRAGLYILRGLFEKYDDPAKVLMAYNMGEYGASVLWKQGITETSYSKKILNRAEEFKTLLKGEV